MGRKFRLSGVVFVFLLGLFSSTARAVVPLSNFSDSGQSLGGTVDSSDVALGDLDGDGDADAVVASYGGTSKVYTNQGGAQGGSPGVFQDSGQNLSANSAVDAALDDLDGDGDLDIFLARDSFGDSNEVYINQGGAQGGTQGVFSFSGQVFGDSLSTSVALADLDGANGPDAFISRSFGQPSKVWLNNGSGTFADSGQTFDTDSNDVALGDLDGDGDIDALSANGANNRIWINQGGAQTGTPGVFLDSGQVLTSTLSLSIDLGDLDGDGDLDAWVGNSASDFIWVNQGGQQGGTEGIFLPGSSTSSGQTRDVALADLDGDGDLDAFLAKSGGNQVWINQGGDQGGTEGVFTDSTQSLGISLTEGVDLGDVDGDLDPDAFAANWAAPDKVWLNQSASPGPDGEGWQVSTIATRGETGLYADLVMDNMDRPHVTYVEYAPVINGMDYKLFYAFWDGVTWQRQFIDSDIHMGDDFGYNAITLDSNGFPHIAYTAGDGSKSLNLKYAYWDGSSWQVQTVDASEDIEPQIALAVDAGGRAHILYQQHDVNELHYTRWDGTQWDTDVVASNLTFRTGHALVLDSNDLPHISFHDSADDVIKYAHFDGSSWQVENVTSSISLIKPNTDITLDPSGEPAIAFSWGYSENEVHFASRNGTNWIDDLVIDMGSLNIQDRVNLAFDGSGQPHILTSPSGLSVQFLVHLYRENNVWISETLDNNGRVGSYNNLAIDTQNQIHAVYFSENYGDLRYISWGPDWTTQNLAAGPVQSPAIQLSNSVPSIGFYDIPGGQVNLGLWQPGWSFFPADFVAAQSDHVDHAAGFSRRHLSWYDADAGRLMYAQRINSVWVQVVVDETSDVGLHNDLELVGSADGLPRLAYWDATFNRVKAAVLTGTNPAPVLYSNTAAPPLNAQSGYTHLTILPDSLLGISYYDGVNDDLRFATLDPLTGDWTDEMVDGGGADVGRLNDVQTDGTDGYPVIAYYDETNDAIKLAYNNGSWQIDTAVSGTGGVIDLALRLGLGSRTRARILFATAAGDLRLAVLKNGSWSVETVLSGAAGLEDVSLALDDRPHIAYNDTGALFYTFRSASLDVDISLPGVLPPDTSGGYYNPLDACQAVLYFFTSSSGPISEEPLRRSFAQGIGDGNLDDLAVFSAMSSLFNATQGGQYYTGLYKQYGSEMGQIGLDDPALLADAGGTLQNFLPGLEAFVTGQGGSVLITQEMVDDALDIWQRVAAAASPGLASVINSELAKYNNLQDFVGMSFDDWAQALGVQPPQTIFLPIVARD